MVTNKFSLLDAPYIWIWWHSGVIRSALCSGLQCPQFKPCILLFFFGCSGKKKFTINVTALEEREEITAPKDS